MTDLVNTAFVDDRYSDTCFGELLDYYVERYAIDRVDADGVPLEESLDGDPYALQAYAAAWVIPVEDWAQYGLL